jgi:hypothetical protein
MKQATLGFGTTLRPKRVFIGKESGCLWYFWDGEKQQPSVINESSLSGYLRGIEKIELTSDYGVSEKLVITIDADTSYQIQVGFATWFSKTFLLNINALDDSQLRSLLTIEPSSNSNSKVVFCNLFDWRSNKIYPKYEWKRDAKGNLIDDLDWDSLVEKISARLPLSSSNDDRSVMEINGNFEEERDLSLAEQIGVEPEALVF